MTISSWAGGVEFILLDFWTFKFPVVKYLYNILYCLTNNQYGVGNTHTQSCSVLKPHNHTHLGIFLMTLKGLYVTNQVHAAVKINN